MASAWGASWGNSWGNSWGSVAVGVMVHQRTILQRHKVDKLLSGYSLSRERLREQRKQWRIDAINARALAKAKKRKEVDQPLGYAKIEYDKYGFEVAAGDAAYHALLQNLEAQQTMRAFQQAQTHQQEAAARMAAIDAFNRHALMQQHMAQMNQFAKDTTEEEEALQLLMMDD